jgi:hypothetical protein
MAFIVQVRDREYVALEGMSWGLKCGTGWRLGGPLWPTMASGGVFD